MRGRDTNALGSLTNFVLSLLRLGTAAAWRSALDVDQAGSGGAVTSVFGRTGAVTAAAGDYAASEVDALPAGNLTGTDVAAQLNELDSNKIETSEKGAPDGVATLDGSGKVPTAQLPSTIVGAVEYQGTWNANTNSPDLGGSSPDKGDYYVVSVAGSTSLGGITDWGLGDWAIYNGAAWEKVDNSEAVSSVFGRTGAVVLTTAGETDDSTLEVNSSKLRVKDGGITVAKLATAVKTLTVSFVIDGGGQAITTGIKGDLVIDFDFTIKQVTLLADQSGSIVIDLWKDTYANYPPTNADSICASAKPTISSATKSQDSTLTGWTVNGSAGDIIRINVDSITTCTRVLVSLKVERR